MNGKSKIVAAVAAGAVALTIGAGAARCPKRAAGAARAGVGKAR